MTNTSTLFLTIPLSQLYFELFTAHKEAHGFKNLEMVEGSLLGYLDHYEAWTAAHPGERFEFGPALTLTALNTSIRGHVEPETKTRFNAFVNSVKGPEGLSSYVHGYQQALLYALKQQTPPQLHLMPTEKALELWFLPPELALLQQLSAKLVAPPASLMYHAINAWLELSKDRLFFPQYKAHATKDWPGQLVCKTFILSLGQWRDAFKLAAYHGVPPESLVYTAFLDWGYKQLQETSAM